MDAAWCEGFLPDSAGLADLEEGLIIERLEEMCEARTTYIPLLNRHHEASQQSKQSPTRKKK